MDPEKEHAHILLISEMGAELAEALDSLAGKPATPIDRYLFSMCQGVCLVSHGFITLVRAGNLHASRVLIRTGIETTLKLAAVYEEPTILYRIAYSEFKEDGKFIKAAGENQVRTNLAAHNAKWEEASKAFAALFPGKELSDDEISVYDLARVAKLPYLYDFYFRLYCNYTHATLRAHSSPEHFVPEVDYSAIESATYATLVVAGKKLGASCAQLTKYSERIRALTEPSKPPPMPQVSSSE